MRTVITFFKNPHTRRQTIVGYTSVALLIVGAWIMNRFNTSELVLLPFFFCLTMYGILVIDSEIEPRRFMIYTGQMARNMGWMYVIFGMFFMLFILIKNLAYLQ